jgi:pimeloyl-ACP methyl ester carboxylesterase
LYGFSSGSVLALKAAARLGDKVARLALDEPPLNSDDKEAKKEFAEFTMHMAELLAADKRGEAVAFFFADMLPPEMIEGMKQSPEWSLMEGVAHTLAYDNAVMGDGSVPAEAAHAASMPALILDGGESPDIKHDAGGCSRRRTAIGSKRTAQKRQHPPCSSSRSLVKRPARKRAYPLIA